MDPRYENVTLFDRRKEEWNHDTLKEHIDEIFSTVEIIEGWEYHGSHWLETIPVTKKEELKKSIFRVIRAKITDPSGKEHEYNLQMPELIDDQFFYIGGFLKVPIFQMFDLPIIFREIPNKPGHNMLKLRTNAITLGVDLNRRDESINVQLFNKDIPFGILLAAYHTKEEWDEFISRHTETKPEQISRIEQIALAEWAKELTEDQRCERVGEYFMNKPNEKHKRGEGILFSLKTAYEVDHFTKRFFSEESILLELIHYIWKGPRSDTSIGYKRIRMAEYILSPLIHKIYDLMVAVFRNYKTKFQIPQNLILDSCSSSTSKNGKNDVAHIIHYNLPYNPVSELASLLQCSLVGPGGFKKENVPPHLRNLDESQFGVVCAADTPDREGCGVINNLVPITQLDENGVFADPVDETVITSYPISLVPFLQNDDPTRLQMASNQLKQSILLTNSSKPWVRSGVECAYLDKTNFLHRAKHKGKVVYKDHGFMIVAYNELDSMETAALTPDQIDELDPVEIDAFAIGFRSLNQGTVDVVESQFDIGDRFVEGDTLCKSKFIKDDELAIGQNLLTAVMVWKGFNYEDGIVISESVVNKLTSLHTSDLSYNVESGQVLLTLEDGTYKPFPEIGQKIKKGDAYAKIKNLDLESGYESINEQAIEKIAPLDCEISSIEIFPNAWNKQIEEFSSKVQEKQDIQLDRYAQIVGSIEPYMTEENIEIFLKVHGFSILNCNDARTGKFHIKGEKIGGIHFRVRGVYAESIGIGDKIANRHGNKGVIARVVADEDMPTMEDGRRPEVIINPLGIISRINVGQLLELHMGECIYQLRRELYEMYEAGKTNRQLRNRVKRFMKIIDVSPDSWVTAKVLEDWDKHNFNADGATKAIEDLYVIQPPFQSTTPDKLKAAMDSVGAKYKYQLVDNESGFDIENPIACGYLYFNKLIHRASDKISARSIGPYNRKTSQPMGGKVHQGGHRLGEMEVWAWLAHNSKDFLRDLLTIHSDSIGKKIDMLAQVLQNPDLAETEDMDDTPQSIRIMESYMNIIGLNMSSDGLRQSSLMECVELAKEQNHDE